METSETKLLSLYDIAAAAYDRLPEKLRLGFKVWANYLWHRRNEIYTLTDAKGNFLGMILAHMEADVLVVDQCVVTSNQVLRDFISRIRPTFPAARFLSFSRPHSAYRKLYNLNNFLRHYGI